MEKIRNFFRVQSNYQLFIISLVFALTGTLALFFADYVLNMFLINQDVYGNISYWAIRIILILPIYQALLIIVGTLFGEFSYFWEMEKNTLRKLGLIIEKNKQ